MEKKTIQTIVAKSLPALSGESLTYNAAKNVYLTLGYTSAAGNMYYKAIRFSEKLAVFYHIGQGYARTFLNGITLFCWDGTKAKIIGQKFWGGYDWRDFSEYFAKEQSILMLRDFLTSQAKLQGAHVSDQDVMAYSRTLIEETQRKQLA
jgi:hypothetical protein